MRYLVDTHYLIWALIEPERIDERSREILLSPDHVKCVSAATFWEISLKHSLGKLRLQGATPEGMLQAAVEAGFVLVPIEAQTAASVHRLPSVSGHRDPFDRLLIWQCITGDLTLLTSDGRLTEYVQHGLKLA